ncbi:MAG: chemotaxis protein CheW [Rubrivivax sp.]|nr:MAG: chemotaxis protein CheW [Rubrivivax sp.]
MSALAKSSPSASMALTVPTSSAAMEPTQYLTFMLAGDMFAIGILSIKEIIQYDSLTTVPMMPDCVRGVINLRGAVVPVMDLLARFGRPSSAVTKRTCIVIVELQVEGDTGLESQVVGVLVDAVNEVIDIAPSDVEPAPAFGARIRTDFIQGMGKVKGKFVILLNAGHVLSMSDIGHLTAAPVQDLLESSLA